MVKDVVKSDYRMIVMWSCFQVVNALKITPLAEKKNAESREETDRLPYVVNHLKRDDNYVVRQSRELIPLLQVLYCNLETQDCQAPFKIKSTLKI